MPVQSKPTIENRVRDAVNSGDLSNLEGLIMCNPSINILLPGIFAGCLYGNIDFAFPEKIPIGIFEIMLDYLGVAVMLPAVMFWEREDVFRYMRDNGFFNSGEIIKAIMKGDDPVKYLNILSKSQDLFISLMNKFHRKYL